MATTVATFSTSYCLSSLCQKQQKKPFQTNHGFVCSRPNSKGVPISSNYHHFTSTKSSALLEETVREKEAYNAEICKYCEMGDLRSAMDLLCDSSARKATIDVRTYGSILQLCADVKSLTDGKKIHMIISSAGAEMDDVLGAKLVFMYVTCGDLREGRRVFDGIGKENIFLWNLIMNDYVKKRDFTESVSLFKQMQELGIIGNSHTFSCVLKCFAALGSVKHGKEVHGYVLRLGFDRYTTVGNAVMAMYFKCKKINLAYNMFVQVPDKDVISWNSMISGLVLNGLAEKAVKTFSEMRHSGVLMDLATIVSILPAYAEMGSLMEGKLLHAYAIKVGLNEEINIHNALLDMYSKCGNLDDAIQVFIRMNKRSVVSWTSMISGYARDGKLDEAIRLFQQMEKEGTKPDLFAVTSIIHACTSNGSLDYGKDIHDYVVRNGLESNLFVANALMDMYAKCGSMADAKSIFDNMVIRDIISWNTIIGGYSKNCLPNEALCTFSEMLLETKPNSVTMACILPACASLSALERGKEIHGHIVRNGFLLDGYLANALVDMYVKCGELVVARFLFDRMPVRDLISWTVMIAGYGMHGRGRDAIDVFKKMRNSGIEPDEVSFIAILYACSHSGLLDEGWRFFNILRNDCKIKPKLEHYACVVDLLSRAGRLSKAYQFIESMPIKPDSTIWGALLCGCRTHRDVKLAEKVADRVFDLEPANTGYYVLLANIYAEAEKWEAVKKIRERIGRRRLTKNPGCSWIEIKSKIHVFVAGDRSYPQSRKIQSLLERVRMRMKEEGYMPNKNCALIDGDDASKEEVLCGHSEKLAIAFGILNLPSGKPIRVTKNLRVCGDCHEMAKYISKMVNRDIIMRDSNRFHHFEGGRCSCRGYW